MTIEMTDILAGMPAAILKNGVTQQSLPKVTYLTLRHY
jgi:hypothetical protein